MIPKEIVNFCKIYVTHDKKKKKVLLFADSLFINNNLDLILDYDYDQLCSDSVFANLFAICIFCNL